MKVKNLDHPVKEVNAGVKMIVDAANDLHKINRQTTLDVYSFGTSLKWAKRPEMRKVNVTIDSQVSDAISSGIFKPMLESGFKVKQTYNHENSIVVEFVGKLVEINFVDLPDPKVNFPGYIEAANWWLDEAVLANMKRSSQGRTANSTETR